MSGGSYIEGNLGWVKAAHRGSEPPLNKEMLWFDITTRLMKRYDFDELIWIPLGEQVSPIYYDPSAGAPLSNVANVNYSLDTSSPDTLKFKTYSEARQWIEDNGSPSEYSPWQINIPSGYIDEVIVTSNSIFTAGQLGTVVGSLEHAASADVGIRNYLSNMIILDFECNTDGAVCGMKGVGIVNLVGSTASSDFPVLRMSDCSVYQYDLTNYILKAKGSEFYSLVDWGVQSHDLVDCRVSSLQDFIGRAVGCKYLVTSTSETVELGVDVVLDNLVLSETSTLEITVPAGATLETRSISTDISVVLEDETATWVNRGDKYDNRVTGMAATEYQSAIDELHHIMSTSSATSIVPTNNTCWVNYDRSTNNNTLRVFKSYADAKDYIDTTGDGAGASVTNQWQIVLGGGRVTETIDIYPYIRVGGVDGTVIALLRSKVVMVSSIAELFSAYVTTCQIERIELTVGTVLYLRNSVVFDVEADSCTVALSGCDVFGGDFTNINLAMAKSTKIWGMSTPIHIPLAGAMDNCDIDSVGAVDLFNGGSINTLTDDTSGRICNAIILSSFNVTVSAELTLINVSQLSPSQSQIEIGSDENVMTEGISERIKVNESCYFAGAWVHTSVRFDGRDSAIESEGVDAAIKEIHKFKNDDDVTYDDWFLPSIDELAAMYNELHQHELGNFSTSWYYWSSTEDSVNPTFALEGAFSTGVLTNLRTKTHYNLVRPCRTFIRVEAVPSLDLRGQGEAGGLIFHIVDNYNGSFTYYEAAPDDLEDMHPWSTDTTQTFADGTAIGSGRDNTDIIVATTPVEAAAVEADDHEISVEAMSVRPLSGKTIDISHISGMPDPTIVPIAEVDAAEYTVAPWNHDISVIRTATGECEITIPAEVNIKGKTLSIADDADNASANNIRIYDDVATPNLLFTIDVDGASYTIRYTGSDWRRR